MGLRSHRLGPSQSLTVKPYGWKGTSGSQEAKGLPWDRRDGGCSGPLWRPALTVWACLVATEQPTQSVCICVADEEGCGTGCSPREARWSQLLASVSRPRARLIWDVGEGCDSRPCSARVGTDGEKHRKTPKGMNVPGGSLCLISLEAVTPHGALFWGKYPWEDGLGLVS